MPELTGKMLQATFKVLASVALVAVASAALSAAPGTEPSWDRAEAMRLAAQTDTFATREALEQLALAGDGPGLLSLLQATARRDDWPVPARESVLHAFTNGLRSLPPQTVADEVMAFLAGYRSRVLVPHDDHPNNNVALFNIRAAAYGVQNAWMRQEAALLGGRLLASDPGMLVAAYRALEHLPARQGFQDALLTATPGQLETVSFLALYDMPAAPDLAALAGRAALLNGDARALEQLVRNANGPALAGILREARERLAAVQLARILQIAVAEGSVPSASLAIAELAPALLDRADVADLVLALLGDPELGSTAALALARNPSTSLLARLDALAQAEEETLSAQRARLALEINRSQFPGGLRQ
jgi:hypothetical protein